MSYSEVVAKIQGDKTKAKELIIQYVNEYEKYEEEMFELQRQLNLVKTNKINAFDNIHFILQHLKMDIPTQVNMNDRIVTIEDNGLVSTYNIL